jgi:Carboxypeptidase regulatory-like domain
MLRTLKLTLVIAALLLPARAALAQEGQIAGIVRDSSDAVMPGVLVEVTSPALIEKLRTATTDGNGQYRITRLPVGTYTVTFTLEGFSKQQRDNVVLTTGFTAPVNATLAVGVRSETVTVVGETPTVDVQNARQVATFASEEIRDLPTARNLRSVLTLTPGLTVTGLGADCVGGVGVWCNNNIYNLSAHTATNDTEGGLQGRVMVNGTIINTGGGAGIMGMTGGYVADIANAQEVSVQISGALGESETGGAAINIIPRTGGNRFRGNFLGSYTRRAWFSKNNSAYPSIDSNYPILNDHDVSLAFGGPIKRDRLWFFSVARDWGKEAFNSQNQNIWDNKNAGIWGMNYQPDRTTAPLNFTNMTRNANIRITYQASLKNKFDIFWDEGLTCQDPCDGAVAAWAPRDGNWSGQVHPARLRQMTWTNPLSRKILLEAGIAANTQLYDFSYHRYVPGHQDIPRVVEFGSTVGMDSVSPLVNSSAAIFGVQSGNLNNGPGGAAEYRNLDDYRPRASIAYVTGSHSAKLGFDGGYFSQRRHNTAGDTRLTYRYDTPLASCLATPGACGNTSLYFPTDPTNTLFRPVPTRVTINTGIADIESKVKYSALYLQDQWTMKRFTLSAAIRYDHATSNYLETCIGPDPYVPVQNGGQFNGSSRYCTPPTDGVSYNDITPRWGATWDIFGTGKTSVKWNMGKYLAGAGISGIYADANPALRSVNELTRTWSDTNGNRRVDCNLLNFNANGECGTPLAGQDSVRYGRDPLSLDAAGIPIGLATTQCGRREQGIPAAVLAYCGLYGNSLLDGMGKRRSEWQFGLGIQHEILPRLSVEVTFNRRKYMNLQATDQLGIGCDRYNGAQDLETCLNALKNYSSNQYDFFKVVAPANPGLPGGGGYTVRGIANPKLTFPVGQPSAVTIMDDLEYTWNGVDTNFVWRGPYGIRLNGGTSTGRGVRDQCRGSLTVAGGSVSELDQPNVKAREGNPPACNPYTRWESNVRGTASYTIPKADVLVATVFQWRPGLERMALWTVPKEQVIWESNSASRATLACTGAQAGQVGCFVPQGTTVTATGYQVNLLDPGDLYTDGYWLFDVKLGKNIRFAGKRLNLGVDIYNLLNNDVVRGYENTFPFSATGVAWGTPNTLLSPRFARLSVAFDF